MNTDTAAALHQALYELRDERTAKVQREQAEAYEAKARGLRDAAALIERALAEEAS